MNYFLQETKMTGYVDLLTLVNLYEKQIQQNSFTKSDAFYHTTKQLLHNIWAKIYELKSSNEKEALTEKIQKCLDSLEKIVEKNEKKKYQQYYSTGRMNVY